jgi:hypothetical protein
MTVFFQEIVAARDCIGATDARTSSVAKPMEMESERTARTSDFSG